MKHYLKVLTVGVCAGVVIAVFKETLDLNSAGKTWDKPRLRKYCDQLEQLIEDSEL